MAISDVLFDAEKGISAWLKTSRYEDDRERLEKLLEDMDAIRLTPGYATTPGRPASPRRKAKEIVEAFTASTPEGDIFADLEDK